ncbi:Cellulase, partial [Actinobacteria bacterium OK074]
ASPTPTATVPQKAPPTAVPLYLHPGSQVQEWVADHPGDPRRAVIESRIADRPAAVWFADYTPDTITARVRAVAAAAAGTDRVPVLVPYAIPDRDCGGASQGGAPDLAAYDSWIDRFAAGLGSAAAVVVLEPDSVAQSDCLTEAQQADRFASLARAGRVLKAADPQARVYYDGGHSGWNPAAEQAALLDRAGAADPAGSDGVFSNVSNFQRTEDEIAYDRALLADLGGPDTLGAVIDTSRNGNGAPADGTWCDPAGRKIGRAPTLTTGENRIDAYLWVKLPGESDGCKGAAGTFSAEYAYELAR